MLPLRRTDSPDPAAPPAQATEARRSTPSISPAPRPSILPGPSVMPGMSMHLHSVLLSGVAGYVDAAGFASLIGLFPAHVTGEIVGDALAFSSGHARDHLTRLWVLPVFVASVVIATLVARVRRRNGQRALTGLLALVTVALALFSASDALARLLHESQHLDFLLGGGCAVAAMGFQNSLMRESLVGSCPTTVMTGNLTHVVIEIVDHLFSKIMRPGKRDRKSRPRLGPVATALMAFVTCAALGGFLTRSMGSSSVLLPTLVVSLLTIDAWREDQRRLASSVLAGKLRPGLLPTFDIWPEALVPRAPGTVAAPDVEVKAAAPVTAAAEAERPPMKRTISGTQLSQRFRDR